MFPTSTLVASTVAPGSYFAGGFAGFEGVAGNLSRSGRAVDRPVTNFSAPEATVGPAQSESAEGVPAIPANDTVFRASGRLVEVYATVTDDRGRYVDDLPANAFTITEEGKPLPAVAFESRTAAVSVGAIRRTF